MTGNKEVVLNVSDKRKSRVNCIIKRNQPEEEGVNLALLSVNMPLFLINQLVNLFNHPLLPAPVCRVCSFEDEVNKEPGPPSTRSSLDSCHSKRKWDPMNWYLLMQGTLRSLLFEVAWPSHNGAQSIQKKTFFYLPTPRDLVSQPQGVIAPLKGVCTDAQWSWSSVLSVWMGALMWLMGHTRTINNIYMNVIPLMLL